MLPRIFITSWVLFKCVVYHFSCRLKEVQIASKIQVLELTVKDQTSEIRQGMHLSLLCQFQNMFPKLKTGLVQHLKKR